MASLPRDSLGFLLPPASASGSQIISSQQASTNPVSLSPPAKWVSIHNNFAAASSRSGQPPANIDLREIKDLIRQRGIPSQFRPTVWFWLSGGAAMQGTLPEGYYQRLAGTTDGVDDTSSMSIEKGTSALFMCFRHHVFLQSPKGSEMLARIMYAVLQHHSSLQYSRQLHQLAAFILVIMGPSHEENAFWTLVGLVTNRLFPAAQGQVALGSFIEQCVLQKLVAKKHSGLAPHLAKIEGQTAGWFATVFTSHLPPETSVRVWDSLMIEGCKVVHRVALALLKRFETVIQSSSQEAVVLKILEMRVSRVMDAEELMQEAFKAVGSFPGSLLTKFRLEVASSQELVRFAAAHALNSSLRLEEQPAPLSNAPPPTTSSLKGWLEGGIRSLSRRNSRSSSMGSMAGSDSGYSSGDGNTSALSDPPVNTASGKPRISSAGKRRVTIMQGPHGAVEDPGDKTPAVISAEPSGGYKGA